MKTLLILVDGMRSDAIKDMPQVKRMMQKAAYTLDAQTVMPSVTLPCHVSLFHSVDPARHGTTTNTYMPQVRPVKGLCEVLLADGKKNTFFYNWEQLRDLSRPGSLAYSCYCGAGDIGFEKANEIVTDEAIAYLEKNDVDFTFLYLGYTDAAGHRFGWMSDEYMDSLESSWGHIERIIDTLTDDYTVFITADHGGHDRTHGTDLPEDMTIPLFIMGENFEPGTKLENVSILDIAPTIADVLGAPADAEWEGKSLKR